MIESTHFNTLNRFDSLINGQKPSTRWRVRKQEAAWPSGGDGQSNVKRSYKKRTAVMTVRVPVMIMSLKGREYALWYKHMVYHCHGSNPAVCICRDPKLMKPEMI
jgi:hypothetical protein